MKKIIMLISILICSACYADEFDLLMIFHQDSPEAPQQNVCVIEVSFAEASNTLTEIKSEFYADLDISALVHFCRDTGCYYEDLPKPLANFDSGMTVSVETIPPVGRRREYITLGCSDLKDAEVKADKIKKSKWFKNKPTMVKIKEKAQ